MTRPTGEFDAERDGYDERDFAIAELCELVDDLRGTIGWSLPQDELDALSRRADIALERYRPASSRISRTASLTNCTRSRNVVMTSTAGF